MTYTKEQRRAYQAEYRRKRRQETIEHLGGKCVKCGSTDNLEINHIDPTKKSFSLARFWGPLSEYWKEVEKCNLLCATHHREETRIQQAAGLVDYRNKKYRSS